MLLSAPIIQYSVRCRELTPCWQDCWKLMGTRWLDWLILCIGCFYEKKKRKKQYYYICRVLWAFPWRTYCFLTKCDSIGENKTLNVWDDSGCSLFYRQRATPTICSLFHQTGLQVTAVMLHKESAQLGLWTVGKHCLHSQLIKRCIFFSYTVYFDNLYTLLLLILILSLLYSVNYYFHFTLNYVFIYFQNWNRANYSKHRLETRISSALIVSWAICVLLCVMCVFFFFPFFLFLI